MKEDKTDRLLFDGGYAKAERISDTTYGYTLFFYNQDHLGNIREVVDAGGNLQQKTNYYPFGAPFADPNMVMNASLQPYKYNGKELDTMHGLNTYDYGARQYDPITGRWDRVDPLAEKYYPFTPYSYCAGNPVNKFDPDGREVHDGLGSYNADNKDLKDLTIELAKQDAPNSIMIVAHGVQNEEGVTTSVNMQTYNQKTKEWEDNYVSTGKDLSNYLSKTDSKVWKEYQAGNIEAKDLKIVLYACGSSEVAKNISSDPQFKDVTFIAPTKDVTYSKKIDNVMVHDTKEQSGRTVLDRSYGKGPGEWNTSRNGHYPLLNSTYSGTSNLRPGTAKFEYKKTFF